jgi:hypothetical protein
MGSMFTKLYKKIKYKGVIATVAVAAVLLWYFNGSSPSSNYVMYSKPGCGWCKKQKAELGGDINRVKVIECSSGCDDIEAYPTWVINGVKSSGFKTKSEIFA